MASSGMLWRVALVRSGVSEELSASFIRVIRIGELGTTLAVTSNRRTQCASVVSHGYVPSSLILVTLMMEALSSSETSVPTRVTHRNIPEHGIIHTHGRGNLKSYMDVFGLHFAVQEVKRIRFIRWYISKLTQRIVALQFVAC
jgi:hypothetical protein